MASMQVLTLALLDRTQLFVEYIGSHGEQSAYSLSLDLKIGNHEGQFDIGGVNFSLSARDIVLQNNILHAKLATSKGDWWEDRLAIDIIFPAGLRREDTPLTRFRRYQPSQLDGCRNLRLIDSFLLAGECLNDSGTYTESYLDLEKHIGIKNGRFEKRGIYFLSDVQNVQLVGTTLYAKLKETHQPLSIELCNILQIKNGAMIPLKEMNSDELENEILIDVCPTRDWLPNARDIRLLNYKQKRQWYLIAECLTPRAMFRESAIKLHEIIGPHAGEMFSYPNFAEMKIPQQAQDTRLENGILTASFDAARDGKWTQSSFDLAEIVCNEEGILSIRKSGSECPRCSSLFLAGAFHTPWEGSRTLLPQTPYQRSQTLQCTFCRLIHSAISAYAPGCDSYETWIMTLCENTGFVRRPRRRDVTLIIRARGVRESTGKMLYNLLKRGKHQIPAMVEIRCSILLEVGGASDKREHEKEGCDPKRYRTIPRNIHEQCWLQPDLRWPTIRRWIDTCEKEHDCLREMSPELPSRYLDIGISDFDVVKVVISNGDSGAYACLSHCWGGKSACTLNESTKSEFLKGISRRILPPVFLDAIVACRKLGLRRLWIDSLCIQQDKKADWEYESTRMGKYYSNCTICIAATSSANSMESLNIAERPVVVRSPGIDPETGPFNLIAYPSNLTQERPHFGHAHDPETLLQNFPLLTRAWVLQERYLSPRVLHFCGSEVAFECTQTTTCECGQARLSMLDKASTSRAGNLRGTTTSQDGLIVRRNQLVALPWTHIVTTYSTLNLTYNIDRLLAISGVASIVQDIQNKSPEGRESEAMPAYLAGIWRNDLPDAMAWFTGSTLIRRNEQENLTEAVAIGIIRKSKPAEYLAPSWSWASVLDPVRYLNMIDVEPMFELLYAHINLSTTNSFGSVEKGCYLHLRGKTLETAWELRSRADETTFFRLTDIAGTQQLNKSDERGIEFSPDYSITKPGRNQIHPATKLYVFPLATVGIMYSTSLRFGDEDNLDHARSTICLVLKKVEGEYDKSDVFERVGFTEYANLQGKGREEMRNVDTNLYSEKEVYLI